MAACLTSHHLAEVISAGKVAAAAVCYEIVLSHCIVHVSAPL